MSLLVVFYYWEIKEHMNCRHRKFSNINKRRSITITCLQHRKVTNPVKVSEMSRKRLFFSRGNLLSKADCNYNTHGLIMLTIALIHNPRNCNFIYGNFVPNHVLLKLFQFLLHVSIDLFFYLLIKLAEQLKGWINLKCKCKMLIG